ncbi:hypothetical protein ACGFY3_12145 [Streptomyces mirabilis]|uniref:hypothetical protein n=1 Tax=Streptomyces mirabilis TaxID=68239 RepID=UPI00371C6603
MGGWGRKRGLRWAAAAGAVAAVAACGPVDTGAAARPSATRAHGTSVASGGACVFVKPDGAQKFGHVGWGFRITGTDRWVYGAVENPSNALYTPPGGDIGAWHAEGTYARMLSDMSRDAIPQALGFARAGGTPIPGKSTHPYSRYRCTDSSTSDVNSARAMIRTVEKRGFLVGVDPETGDLGSRDCLDATYDVLRAYRTRHLTPAYPTEIPNLWVETLVLWSDSALKPR